MPTRIEKLEAQMLRLDLEARAALAQKLLESLDDLSEAENERLWLAEAKRREQELLGGKVRARDGNGVLRRASAEIS